ncbi:hypothetical protein PAHAL_4G023100 [Panicum hallii]|jgi:hypothetical protein|uniref:Uncharacterized protein n=1 Tax=Panicum hallii TaxID=206008 RepID=A0A2T8JBH4_9POAL|nr:hypothetical protein PAHAL_4G023100 [Panicum hallii]
MSVDLNPPHRLFTTSFTCAVHHRSSEQIHTPRPPSLHLPPVRVRCATGPDWRRSTRPRHHVRPWMPPRCDRARGQGGRREDQTVTRARGTASAWPVVTRDVRGAPADWCACSLLGVASTATYAAGPASFGLGRKPTSARGGFLCRRSPENKHAHNSLEHSATA